MKDTKGFTCCPRCETWVAVTRRAALSRKDRRTVVCDSCGRDEALRDHEGLDPWPGFPGKATSTEAA